MDSLLPRLAALAALALSPVPGHGAGDAPAPPRPLRLALEVTVPARVPAEPGAAWRNWHGVLFRVSPPREGDRGATAAAPPASYLFGSIHYGTLAEVDIDADDLKPVLAETRTLVSETVADAAFDPRDDALRYLPAAEPLPQLIGNEAFASLQTLLPAQPKDALRRFKPWLVLALLESRGEIAGPDNLDGRVAEWGREAGLKTVALETLHEQMTALDCVPATEHAEVLRQRIAAPWVLREQSAEVLGFYRNRDLVAWMDEVDSMAGLDERARAIETRSKRCLIDARNARWIDRLDPMLRAGSCFVAVGAIHLMGDSGLLNQLAMRGYTVVAQTL